MEVFEYCTFFGVRLGRDKDMIPKFSIDFIMRWTTNDKENSKLAEEMIKNELFKTTSAEAVEAVGLGEIASNLSSVSLRMRFNPDITAHMFVTKFPMTDEWLQTMIDYANICDDGKKKLSEALIRI